MEFTRRTEALLVGYRSESMQWSAANLDAAMDVLMNASTKHVVWTEIVSLYVKDSIEVLRRHGVRIDEGYVNFSTLVACVGHCVCGGVCGCVDVDASAQ